MHCEVLWVSKVKRGLFGHFCIRRSVKATEITNQFINDDARDLSLHTLYRKFLLVKLLNSHFVHVSMLSIIHHRKFILNACIHANNWSVKGLMAVQILFLFISCRRAHFWKTIRVETVCTRSHCWKITSERLEGMYDFIIKWDLFLCHRSRIFKYFHAFTHSGLPVTSLSCSPHFQPAMATWNRIVLPNTKFYV